MITKYYAIYALVGGRILRCYTGSNPELQLMKGEAFIEFDDILHDDTTHYVVNGVIVDRPEMGSWSTTTISANGADAAIFDGNMPATVQLFMTTPPGVDNIESVITDASVQLQTLAEGDHEITLRAFPYRSHTQTITVTPAGSSGLDTYLYTQAFSAIYSIENEAQSLESFRYTQTPINARTSNSDQGLVVEALKVPQFSVVLSIADLDDRLETAQYTQTNTTILFASVQTFDPVLNYSGGVILDDSSDYRTFGAFNTLAVTQNAGLVMESSNQTFDVATCLVSSALFQGTFNSYDSVIVNQSTLILEEITQSFDADYIRQTAFDTLYDQSVIDWSLISQASDQLFERLYLNQTTEFEQQISQQFEVNTIQQTSFDIN